MNNHHESKGFKKLLDKLQQESWQLELIISGFAIYGLFQCQDLIELKIVSAIENEQGMFRFLLHTSKTAIWIILITLLIHVILRGLWIGALGLRYVSGDIDFEQLGHKGKFDSYLKNRIGSFDKYVAQLENICSSLFALAFLTAFNFIAFILVLAFMALLLHGIDSIFWFSDSTNQTISILFVFTYLLFATVFLGDFLTMGALKKDREVAKFYYPLYRFFSVITLSFLYRPLLYNFLDQQKSKWVATYLLPAYLILSIFGSAYGTKTSNYLMTNIESSESFTSKKSYFNEMSETDISDFAYIPSKVIHTDYLQLSIPHTRFKEDQVFAKDSSLILKKDQRDYHFDFSDGIQIPGINVKFSSRNKEFLNKLKGQKRYLEIISELYKVLIDSTTYYTDFHYSVNSRERFVFDTYLDIKYLPRGKHILRVLGPVKLPISDEVITDTLTTIPFWYYPTQTFSQEIQANTPITDSLP